VEVVVVKTTGDEVTDRALSSLGGQGAFVKELDNQILEGKVDVAVNSLKDMPVDPTYGTELTAVLPRGPVEDVLLPDIELEELPRGARVGTSSVRRAALLLNLRPDLKVLDIRGNVPTRIRKLREGRYDAIVLARAGLVRLGLEEPHSILDPIDFVPAGGQGSIALVCAEGSEVSSLIRSMDHERTRTEVEVERTMLRLLGGGCSVPIGVRASVIEGGIDLSGIVLTTDGSECVRVRERLALPLNMERLREIVEILRPGLEISP
jgi:hydroxymethylbilane synthase